MLRFLRPLFKPTFRPVPNAISPVVLISLDGWGIAPDSHGNAITQANTPNWDSYLQTYPNSQLIASGESVGLPANEVGNSEVGHLTMGVGRVIFESLLRINKSIEDESFFRNEAFLAAVEHVQTNQSTLHLLGLLGAGNVHSSSSHLYALLELAKRAKLPKVCLHVFTDGRDSPPHDGVNAITTLEFEIKEHYPFARIASIAGRYYAMDRDTRWERTQKAYEAIVLGKGVEHTNAITAISESYKAGKTDEFIEATVLLDAQGNCTPVNDNDACIFFNFRVDRPRQLTKAFVLPDFESGAFQFEEEKKTPSAFHQPKPTFTRTKRPSNLFFVTMTEYQQGLPVSKIAFPNDTVEHSLPEVLAAHQLRQFHLAESEKERMVTYYFDGLRIEKFPGEDTLIIPSPSVGTYDRKPEMSLPGIVDAFKTALSSNTYHFFMLNFANPDMVAHSGKLKATIKACEIVDWALGEMVPMVLAVGGTVYITADHGNAEELLTFDSSGFFFTTREGAMNTEHSNNPVPFVMINAQYAGKPQALADGSLADVAPTILTQLHLPIPPQMTGHNLLK